MWEAAELIPPAFFDLINHPDCFELMTMAFTIRDGRNAAEVANKLNKDYHNTAKEFWKQVDKVRKQQSGSGFSRTPEQLEELRKKKAAKNG